MIDLRVMDETHMIYQHPVSRVHFPGSYGEFEVAADHAPILSLLKKGSIVIKGAREASSGQRPAYSVERIAVETKADLSAKRYPLNALQIPIERGIMKLETNRIIAIVELADNA